MSGLPAWPSNLEVTDAMNPAAGCTAEQVYDFLGAYALTRAPGSTYEFSNYGVGLLGQILADFKGMGFEALMRQRVIEVLGLKDTVIKLSAAEKSRSPTPYVGVVRYPATDCGALAPTGEMHSSVRDLLSYLGANLGMPQTPLFRALTNTHSPRYRATDGTWVGLAWTIRTAGSVSCVENAGRGGAFSRYVGFIPEQKRAVVILATGYLTADDLGRSLLSSTYPKFTSYPVPAQATTRTLRDYVGTYSYPQAGIYYQIGLERGHLTLSSASVDPMPLMLYGAQSSKNKFLLTPRFGNCTVVFNANAQGQVISLYWSSPWSSGRLDKGSELILAP
jgi:serine-type D-Ala-D-Ala carboxypeptidase/endopeptidase